MLAKTFKLLMIILSLSSCKVNAQTTAAASAAVPAILPFTHDVDSVFQNWIKAASPPASYTTGFILLPY